MTQLQFDFDSVVTSDARPTPAVVHALMPNMGLACGTPILDAYARGERTWYGRRDHKDVTCPWCHSLGRSWFSWVCAVMQGRDPISGFVRCTDRERAQLAGIEAA